MLRNLEPVVIIQCKYPTCLPTDQWPS